MHISYNFALKKQVNYESVKCLRIILDKNLFWKPQINQLYKKDSSEGVPLAKFTYFTLYEVQMHTA